MRRLAMGLLFLACGPAPEPKPPAPQEIVIEYAIVSPRWVEQFVRTDGDDYKAFAADPASTKRIAEVRHILIRGEDRKKAEAVLERLKKEDFAEVAKSVSEDGSKMRGGAVGTDTSRFVEPFRNAADALDPGETSGIVQTQFGMHIIKKDAVTPETTAAAWRKMKSADVAKQVAAQILTKRAGAKSMEDAVTTAIQSALGDVAARDAERPVARTFDPGLEQDALTACGDRKEHFRRLLARAKAEPPAQQTLLCVELSQLARFAHTAKPNATLVLPLPKHDTLFSPEGESRTSLRAKSFDDPLVAFAALK